MINILLIVQAVLAFGIVLFTLGFLITSLMEKESRAAMMAGVLCGLLVVAELCIYFLHTLGFFSHVVGMLLIVIISIAAFGSIYFLCRQTSPNQRALKGVEGYVVGNAARYDEREQVFARERTLRPNSAEYKEFYRMHP